MNWKSPLGQLVAAGTVSASLILLGCCHCLMVATSCCKTDRKSLLVLVAVAEMGVASLLLLGCCQSLRKELRHLTWLRG